MPAGGGWFAVYRSVFERWKAEPEEGFAWLWILSRTRYEPDGDLGRGEVRISTRGLADAMGWTRPKAQRFIKRLIRGGEIRSLNRSPNRSTAARPFLVVRYDDLQPSRKRADPPTDPPTDPHVRSEEFKKKPKAKRTSKSNGVTTPARRAASLSEQRAFLAEEIRKKEADA